MSFETDRLIDRRRLKRRLNVWRVVAIVAVVSLAVAVGGRFADDMASTWGGDYVAQLNVHGLIIDDQDRDAVLRDVAGDDRAKALIVHIDSPGGSVVGGEALFLGLREVAADKPVVAVMSEVATSAGYMTALGADRIFARSGSVTGSIGVIMQTADITGLLEKIGIKPETVKSAALKAQPNPLEPFTPEAREAVRAVVLDFFELFVNLVVDRRGLPREQVLALADGRVFSGRQAVAQGLVDALGGEEAARAWLAEIHEIDPELPVRRLQIQREDQAWREFLQGIFGKALFSERLRLDGLVSLWHPDLW
jgi:protease-4